MSAIDLAAGLVRQSEGCKLTAYRDGGGVWTIGYGHTAEAKEGLVWTQEQAERALTTDLQNAAMGLFSLIKAKLTDKQMAALISLAFNVGPSALKGSTLINAVNDGRWADVVRQFIAWDHDGGREVKGLLHRRLTEAATYLEGA